MLVTNWCWWCRRDFGNNPDISKALRLLVAEKNVMRAGKGGRADPFTYQVGLLHLTNCLLLYSVTSNMAALPQNAAFKCLKLQPAHNCEPY